MATAELRLSLPVDAARDAVALALSEQGFTVRPAASGSLDVSRGSLGTTLVAGALAGQDMHVRFDVHLSAVAEGTLAAFEHSAVGGFFKGGAIGAAKVGDVVREAAHVARARLAHQGVLVGSAPAEGDAGSVAPGSVAPTFAPPVPEMSAGEAAATGAGSAPVTEPAAVGATAPTTPYAAGYPGAAGGYPGYAGPAGGYPGAPDPSGASAYAASPYAATGASDRTNGIAILAIILGFVLPIGGIVAGAVALAQIKRTGEKGRGLAIGGIIAGSVITALTFLVGIAFVIFTLVVGATTSSADPFVPSLPDGGGVTIAPNEQAPSDAYTLAVSSCLDEIPSGVIMPSNVVACDGPHVYEVFGSFFLSDGSFPGVDAVDSAVFEGCDAAFVSYVGIPYEDSALEYSYVAPDESTWADGDREVSCLLYDPSTTETTGSLAGSAR